MDLNKIYKDWNARGFTCDEWVDPPGQQWLNYVHKTDELLMVIEGKLSLEINGQENEALPGKEFFIAAHTIHNVKNSGENTVRWLYGYKKQSK